jgi:CxxC motif-containing protein (DUF1111 family)
VCAPVRAADPGPRRSSVDAGEPLPGLSASQLAAFELGRERFEESEGVGEGLGPRFNLDSCGGCHSQPAIGGTSPAENPQLAVATAFGARNRVPSFLALDGPIREARFRFRRDGSRDGGVRSLFTIAGRVDESGDASGCAIAQDDFERAARAHNLTFRIPTPVFGAGLIEAIPDAAILANASAHAQRKSALGIAGRPSRARQPGPDANRNGNDGTIARFGWKAQNKSLLLFAGEAYNVEMGITNELFQTERDETSECQFAATPNDFTDTDAESADESRSDLENFALFMRFLAAPTPSSSEPGGSASIAAGRAIFDRVGCADCHTPELRTGNAAVEALRDRPVALYSDLLLHRMGPRLADEVEQGAGGPDEFRTAPLWGLGQRLFFLHDGRTSDLVAAIEAHASAGSLRFPPSEANAVVGAYRRLTEDDEQNLLNFLRSL